MSDQKKNLIQLFKVISQQLPMSEAHSLLHEHLSCYMNNKKMGSNKSTWFKWVSFLHKTANKKMNSLSIKVQDLQEKQDIIEASVCWNAQVNGKKETSDTKKVIYQFKNNKIINIWTHKSNYTFIYGKKIANNKFYFYWLMICIFFSSKNWKKAPQTKKTYFFCCKESYYYRI